MKIKNALLNNTDAIKRLKRESAKALPCLSSNISIGTGIETNSTDSSTEVRAINSKQNQLNEFSTSHKKSAYALEVNVKSFIDYFGINHVGFLTLTFADNVQCAKEAQRRFNSLRTNFLKRYYKHYIRVIERTKNGRIHYHLIVACKEDIRRNLNFQQIANKNYKSASSAIKKHWSLLRNAMKKYGFGRSELLPVRTNSSGLARYVAKYIGKHINSRIAADKNIRLCQCSIDKKTVWKVATSYFQFFSAGSTQWRLKLQKFLMRVDELLFLDAITQRIHVVDFNIIYSEYKQITQDNYSEIMCKNFGSKWAFLNRETIKLM